MFNVQDIKNIFKEISRLMDSNKEFLCQLDGTLGDGDIGITMSKGFSAIKEASLKDKEQDIGSLVFSYGMIMAEKAPSTMGTLLASAFLKAGNQFKGKQQLSFNDFVIFIETMIQGIKERGKAQFGDKTILDSFIPALESLKNSAEKKENILQSIQKAHNSAEKGMKNTINLKSRKGRAARYLEDSIGKQDPGATVGALFFEGILQYVSKKEI
ncbi:dihydroxyacetone kinase subunit DhaL [Metabacillus arenae]|uniref:phosphoenolpyruvate--glycerone phosphotransferase n=1 Tax=Metabacillus arenae TaxID=2771434 RepID=A0A926NHY3_9BACI|nr:dihydroxyacetone kinase subunit DhaL [Metabacillus arenae]MBD1381999.1 dihydroxyacetone kinase subunit L [Metabacillus arenae]